MNNESSEKKRDFNKYELIFLFLFGGLTIYLLLVWIVCLAMDIEFSWRLLISIPIVLISIPKLLLSLLRSLSRVSSNEEKTFSEIIVSICLRLFIYLFIGLIIISTFIQFNNNFNSQQHEENISSEVLNKDNKSMKIKVNENKEGKIQTIATADSNNNDKIGGRIENKKDAEGREEKDDNVIKNESIDSLKSIVTENLDSMKNVSPPVPIGLNHQVNSKELNEVKTSKSIVVESSISDEKEELPNEILDKRAGNSNNVQVPSIQKYSINFNVTPSDAKIDITNIKDIFYQGIQLAKGKYYIDISKQGYKTFKNSVDLTKNESFNIVLQKENTSFITPANTSQIQPMSSENNMDVQTVDENPIDRELNNCIDTDGTTVGMNGCYKKALIEWDGELNRVYKILGGSKNIKLRNAQRIWIKSRDSQIENLKDEYLNRDGTMWSNVYNEKVMNITKIRVLQLIDMMNY